MTRPTPPAAPVLSGQAIQRRKWRRNCSLIAGLLAIWALVTFAPSYFARDLGFSVFGWPFSFWMAAYGAPLAYLVIIGVYAWVMNRSANQDPTDGTVR